MKLKVLVGNGGKIGLFSLPFFATGIILNILFPEFFSTGYSTILSVISAVILAAGITVWIWCVILILTKIPRKELMTRGPYSLVKHPLYTGVALLVLPWLGFLLNTWLGVLLGIILYTGSRIYAPGEEIILAKIFGTKWEDYCSSVKLPWL